jgi:hypothetical protein
MGAEHPIMQENLPVERLVRTALCAEEPIGRPGIRQLGIPQGAKRLEEPLIHRIFFPDNLEKRLLSCKVYLIIFSQGGNRCQVQKIKACLMKFGIT